MKESRKLFLVVMAAVGLLTMTMVVSAWFHIQATRWAYKSQKLRRELDDFQKREQVLDSKLDTMLSLTRLDDLARTRYHLHVPNPAQIVWMVPVRARPVS